MSGVGRFIEKKFLIVQYNLLFVFLVALFLPSISFGATIYTNYGSGNDTTGDGTSGAPYKTFHKAYTMASAGDTISLSGTFSWANADETGDSATSGYTIGKELTIIGESATSTIIQAAASVGSAGKRVFTISASASTTIKNLTIRYGSGTNGAGIYINANATTTLTNLEIKSNRTGTSGNGGGVYVADADLYVSGTTFYDNAGGLYGGGIYTSASGKTITVTNSTFYYNYTQWSSNSTDGAGIYIATGDVTVTNSTLVKNGDSLDATARNTSYGGGILVGNSANAKLYIKNSIVAQNIGDITGPNIYKYSSGVITNAGYNIVGKSNGFTGTTGDWVDSTDSGTFTLNTVGTTGTLGLSTGWALNDTNTGTPTYSVNTTSSIVVNNADGSVHNGVDIPALDQRGATRSGATDIGAYEVNGTGLTVFQPTTQSSSISFSALEYNSMSINWVNGNGARRVVFMKEGSSGTASPSDGTSYTASSVFGSGTQIGSTGWYAVYNDNGTSTNSYVSVTGLTRSTTYIVQIFDYNGVASDNADYFGDTATNNPNTQMTYTPTTLYVNYSTGNDTTGDGTSGNPYKTFHKAYTIAKNKDTIRLSGTFNWANADETGDASTSGYTLSKELTIQGDSATSTIIQAASTEGSAGKRVFTISASASTTINNIMLRYGSGGSGACLSVSTNATTTLNNVDINTCIGSTSGYGGGIYISGASVTINNSSIYNNAGGIMGGGIYFDAVNKELIITNSTMYYNYNTWCCNALEGGAIKINSGTTTLTNSTIVKNGIKSDNSGRKVYTGGGIAITSSANAKLLIKNSIVAENIGDPSGTPNIYKGSSGIITNSGYNIVGKSSGYTATTGDWVDSTDSGTFTLNTVGTTGSLNLDTAPADNNSTVGTITWGILANSVAINGSNGVAHNGVDIPSTDQRGAGRASTADIGAFEYGGILVDSTAPTISLTAPSADAVVSGASVVLSANASDSFGVAGVRFYIDDLASGSEDTSSAYGITWNSTGATNASHTAFAVARDTSNNYATSSSVTFNVDNTNPAFSLITASSTINGAVITWTTDSNTSSQINFGLTDSYSSSTPETNTAPRVTEHSVTISGLPRCARFHYQVQGKNSALATFTSSDYTFRTAGCTANTTISSTGAGSILTASGGTVTDTGISLTIPTGFTSTSSSATFQTNKLDGSAFFAGVTGPSGKNRIGTNVFNLKALTDATTTLSSFNIAITVTLSYTSSDVVDIEESSLKIYRYDGTSWSALSNCTVNTSAKTVTCDTTEFSDFALFGDEYVETVSTSTSSSSSSNGPVMGISASILPGYKKPRSQTIYPDGTILYHDEIVVRSQDSPTVSNSTNQSYRFTKNLKLGMEDPDVKILQIFLNTRGFMVAKSGYGSSGNETNYFGRLTKNALAKFQESNKIDPPLGNFGPITRGFLNN